MKILLVGDIHGNLKYFNLAVKEAEKNNCEKIIQLGDFGYYPYLIPNFVDNLQSSIPFYFIDGNHEDHFHLHHNALEPYEVRENIYHIPRGFSSMWEGIKLLFIGGARSEDRSARTLGVDYFVDEEITYGQYFKCLDVGKVDIIFSHESPNTSLTTYDNPSYSKQAINNLVEKLEPSLLFHGHHHCNYTAMYDATVVKGLGCKPSDMFEILCL